MNQYFKSHLSLVVFLISTIISNSQTWTNFTNTQQINSTVLDKDGTLWCATEGGVAKYDGSKWTKYTTIDGLLANQTTSIVMDSTNNIWVSLNQGISKFNGTRWINYVPNIPFNINGFPTVIASDKFGNIWYGTFDGLFKFNGTTWVQCLTDKHITCITSDKSGVVWVGTTNGMYTFDGTDSVHYTTADGLVEDHVVDIGIEPNGTKWILNFNAISKYDGLNWTALASPVNYLSLKSISFDAIGNKWIVAINNFGGFRDSPNEQECKVLKFDGVNWIDQHYIDYFEYNGLITSIKVDAQGNKWCATYKGIQLLNSNNQWSSLNTYNSSNGLVNKSVTTIAVENSGAKWIGTSNGVSRFDGKNWQNYTTNDGLCNPMITTIAIDSSGNKWFGTSNGLSKFDGTHWTTYNTTNSLPSNNIKAIAVDYNNIVWVGTDNGVAAYDGISWKIYKASDGLNSNIIYSIAIDKQGNKWFGTQSGISKFNNIAWQNISGVRSELLVFDALGNLFYKQRYYETSPFVWKCRVYKFDGTNFTQIYNGDDIQYLVIDSKGKKWMGVSGGVSIYDDLNWQYLTSYDFTYRESDNNLNGIRGMLISCIAIDKNGDIIFGSSNKGITISGNGMWNDYTVEKCLVANNVFSIAIDKKGNKWIGTNDGFSHFDDVNWFTYCSQDYNYEYKSPRPVKLVIGKLNNKWFMQGQYLYKLNDTTITIHSRSGINYTSLAIDSNNYVWITAGDWILRLNDEPNGYEFYAYPENPKYIYIDNKNNKWLGFNKSFALATETLHDIDVGTFDYTHTINMSDNPDISTVRAAYIDNNGNKWIGTNAGLYYHNGNSLKFYSTKNGLVNNYINAIAADSKGNIWIGTNGGVSKFNGTSWKNYTTLDGLADNTVNCIAIDVYDNKWFGTTNGLSKFSDKNTGGTQPTDISDYITSSSNVIIYPNPSSNSINFEGVTSGSTLQLLTMDGRILKNIIYSGNPIDISNLENGMYLVKISNSNTTETKKIIKQ